MPTSPIVYDVENIRDGKSFSTRRVQAIQYGKPIFYMTASFQKTEQGFEHQAEMPKVAGPEQLRPDIDFYRENAGLIPEKLRDKFICEKPHRIPSGRLSRILLKSAKGEPVKIRVAESQRPDAR